MDDIGLCKWDCNIRFQEFIYLLSQYCFFAFSFWFKFWFFGGRGIGLISWGFFLFVGFVWVWGLGFGGLFVCATKELCREDIDCCYFSSDQHKVSEFWSPGTNFQKYNEEIAENISDLLVPQVLPKSYLVSNKTPT